MTLTKIRLLLRNIVIQYVYSACGLKARECKQYVSLLVYIGDVMEQMKISEPWKHSLQELTPRLAGVIEAKSSPDRFGDVLVGKGFVTEHTKRDRLNVLGVYDYAKIASLLDAVSTDINNAGNKPKRFNDFVAILNDLDLRDVGKELIECYRK